MRTNDKQMSKCSVIKLTDFPIYFLNDSNIKWNTENLVVYSVHPYFQGHLMLPIEHWYASWVSKFAFYCFNHINLSA